MKEIEVLNLKSVKDWFCYKKYVGEETMSNIIMILRSLIPSFDLMSISKYICDWICKIRL